MKNEQLHFLTLLDQGPARLTVEQIAYLLNCEPHAVPFLFRAKLLKPIGNPPQNGCKMVATVEILEKVKDVAWLAKVTNKIHEVWREKNARKSHRQKNEGGVGALPSRNGQD